MTASDELFIPLSNDELTEVVVQKAIDAINQKADRPFITRHSILHQGSYVAQALVDQLKSRYKFLVTIRAMIADYQRSPASGLLAIEDLVAGELDEFKGSSENGIPRNVVSQITSVVTLGEFEAVRTILNEAGFEITKKAE